MRTGRSRRILTQNQNALNNLPALEISDTDRDVLRNIFEHNVAFMTRCLAQGTFTYQELETYARNCAKYSVKTIDIGANAQVTHWMEVLDDWKKMLGKDWDKLYAVTNTLYVTRQNNILFTILAQYMGKEAINERLLLLETSEFTTTPEKMLDVLTRIVADRPLGKVFFGDYYLMDVELLGGGARRVIEAEAVRRGMQPLLPTQGAVLLQ